LQLSHDNKKLHHRSHSGAVPECETAKVYPKRVESQLTGSTKAYASTLIKKLINTNYTGGGVSKHIIRMSNMATKLKPMKMGLEDEFISLLLFQRSLILL
jgi:hypothetical protein